MIAITLKYNPLITVDIYIVLQINNNSATISKYKVDNIGNFVRL